MSDAPETIWVVEAEPNISRDEPGELFAGYDESEYQLQQKAVCYETVPVEYIRRDRVKVTGFEDAPQWQPIETAPMGMTDSELQSALTEAFNKTLREWAEDDPDTEFPVMVALLALDDAKSDAPTILARVKKAHDEREE